MTGTLVPPWFEKYHVSSAELAVVSVVWGLSLGCAAIAAAKAIQQSRQTWHRCRRVTLYIFMVWTELIVSIIIGIISWLYMKDMIQPSFEYFFFVLVLWVIQIQVLLQIIINRIGLLLPDQRRVNRMKWVVVGYVGIINVSVFCIWLPAQLQRSQKYVDINHVWDRTEKVLFLLIDAGLNFYFMYLVRRNLIENGLSKYKRLFWTNVGLDVLSIFLDLAIILSMSFKNPFIYVQFHPLAYIVKLTIEMSLADLLARIARDSNFSGGGLGSTSYINQSHNSRTRAAALRALGNGPITNKIGTQEKKDSSENPLVEDGITKTVAMEMTEMYRASRRKSYREIDDSIQIPPAHVR